MNLARPFRWSRDGTLRPVSFFRQDECRCRYFNADVCGLAVILLSLFTVTLVRAEDVGPHFRWRLQDGSIRHRRLSLPAVENVSASVPGAPEFAEWSTITELEARPRSRDVLEWLPLRRIVLTNGDSVTATVLKIQADRLECLTDRLQPLDLRRVGVRRIEALPELVEWGLEWDAAVSQLPAMQRSLFAPDVVRGVVTYRVRNGGRIEWSTGLRVPDSEFTCWVRVPLSGQSLARIQWPEVARSDDRSIAEITFQAGSARRVQVLTGTGELVGDAAISGSDEWVCLRVVHSSPAIVGVNAQRLDVGSAVPSLTAASRFQSEAPDADQPPSIGPVFVQAPAEKPRRESLTSLTEGVRLKSGDAFFGPARSSTAGRVQVAVRDRKIDVAWSEVLAVALHAERGPVFSATERAGWYVRVDRHEVARPRGSTAGGALHGLVSRATAMGLVLETAAGPIDIDWDSVRRITPLFRGNQQLIEPSWRHLGTQHREDFARPRPEGVRLSLSVDLTTLPTTTCFMSLRVRDLEPSGPDTLKGSPTLKDLHRGYLSTELFLNGQRVARLNDLTSQRPDPAQPIRLQVLLPTALLQLGTNTLEFVQQPSPLDETRYDDCELSDMAIEWQTADAPDVRGP